MPQEGNRTGLQEVWREESGMQLGGAAEEDRKEGREGRGMAAVVVRARGRQRSVVVGVGRAGFADSDQHGLDGEIGNGGGKDWKGLELVAERLGDRKEKEKVKKSVETQTEEVSEGEEMETESETDGEEAEEEKEEKEDEEEKVEEVGEGEKEKEDKNGEE